MNGKIHKANYVFLFILLVLYGTSLLCEILYIKDNKDDDEKNELLYYSYIIDIAVLIIIIFLSLCFGFYSLYFSSKERLLHYVITLFIFLLIQLTLSVFLYFEINDTIISTDKISVKINFVSISLQIFLCLIHSILCFVERHMIIQEIKDSPLNYVDENITEDIYKSILSQSQNPEDKMLKENFQKFLSINRKDSINSNSSYKEGNN